VNIFGLLQEEKKILKRCFYAIANLNQAFLPGKNINFLQLLQNMAPTIYVKEETKSPF
jgi:hypothetical protein